MLSQSKLLESSSAASQSDFFDKSVFAHAKLSEQLFRFRLRFADDLFDIVAKTPYIETAKKEAIWADMRGIIKARTDYVDQQMLILHKEISAAQKAKELYITINKHHNDMSKC